MIENRLVAFIKPVLLWSMLLLALLAVAAGFAHADTGAPVTADPGLGFEGKLAAISVTVYTIARTVLEILKVVAPRTKTKLDDEARDVLSEVLTHEPPPAPVPRDPQAGRVGMWPLIILAGAAIGIASQAMWFGGCATAERAGGAAKVAALDCGKPQLATAASLVARWAVEDALAGKIQWATHETDATGFGLGVATCAYAELRAAYKAKPTVQALAAGPPPDDGSAGLERLRAKLGGGEIRLADGSVQ